MGLGFGLVDIKVLGVKYTAYVRPHTIIHRERCTHTHTHTARLSDLHAYTPTRTHHTHTH